jgi:hypothetical protein
MNRSWVRSRAAKLSVFAIIAKRRGRFNPRVDTRMQDAANHER